MIISEKVCIMEKSKSQHILDLVSYIAKIGDKVDMADIVEYLNVINCKNDFSSYEAIDALLMEILAQAEISARSDNPFVHLVLSWSEGELPTNEQIDEAVKITLEELGYINCQALYGVHKNTAYRHCHLFVNRVDLLTDKVCSDSFSRYKMSKAMAKIDSIQGWQSPQNATYEYDAKTEEFSKIREPQPDENLSNGALASERYTGYQSAERIIKEYVEEILKKESWESVQFYLAQRGITIDKKKSGSIFTMLFDNGKSILVKPSKVSRKLSYTNLVARWGEFEKYSFDVKPHKMLPLNCVNTTLYKNIYHNTNKDIEHEYSKNLELTKLYPMPQPAITAMKKIIVEDKDKKKRKNKEDLEKALNSTSEVNSICYAYNGDNFSFEETTIYSFTQYIIKDTGNRLILLQLGNNAIPQSIQTLLNIIDRNTINIEECVFEGTEEFKKAVAEELEKRKIELSFSNEASLELEV